MADATDLAMTRKAAVRSASTLEPSVNHLVQVLSVAMFVIAASLVRADQTIEANRVIQIDLHSDKAYANPFMEVELDAIVTRPDDKQLRVPAFWDGADRKAKGFSVVQIVCGRYRDEGYFQPRWENEGGKPYTTEDFTVIILAYFEYAGRHIKHESIKPTLLSGGPACLG